ncbi:apoptosis-associated speck-like protein containing a CARD [Lissotriton helveticus]
MADGGSTSGDLLLHALEDLTKDDFRRFKDKVSEINFNGERNIPRGSLEDADRIDTKNLLVERYGKDSAIEATIQALAKVGLMGAAARLREKQQPGSSDATSDYPPKRKQRECPRSSPGSPGTHIVGSLAPTAESFIRRHRLDLIKRMGIITPIIEILRHKGILQDEEFDEVLAQSTSHSKNSKLIQIVLNKGAKSQQEFVLALQKKDLPLYNDLQQSN